MDFGLGLADVIGAFVGFVLTLLVFSYIFGDNVLFRIAMHIFIGVAAGYVVAISVYKGAFHCIRLSVSCAPTYQNRYGSTHTQNTPLDPTHSVLIFIAARYPVHTFNRCDSDVPQPEREQSSEEPFRHNDSGWVLFE